jgi:hypothetical protein
MGSGLRRSEKDWERQIHRSCNTHMHGKNTRTLPVLEIKLSLSQIRKTSWFSFLSYVFSSTKLENGSVEQVLPRDRVGGLAPVGGRRW